MKKCSKKKTKKKSTFLRTLLRIAGALIACAAAVAAVCCVIRRVTKKVCTPEPSEKNDADDKELNELLDSINETEAAADTDEDFVVELEELNASEDTVGETVEGGSAKPEEEQS